MTMACVLMAALSLPASGGQEPGPVEPPLLRSNDPLVAWMGRVDRTDPARPRLGFPGVTIRVRFEGPTLALRASDTGHSAFDVIVDGGDARVVRLGEAVERDYVLAEGLDDAVHVADIVRRTETWQGIVTVAGFRLAPGKRLLEPTPWPLRRLLFIGDSVTAGEGTDRQGDCAKDAPRFANARLSYGMRLGRVLDAQVHLVAFGGRGLTRDWRGRSDVLTAPRFFELQIPEDEGHPPPFDHASYVPDGVVVSLGTNDLNLAPGPLPRRDEFVAAYVRFVRTIRARYRGAHVFLTEGAIVNDAADPVQKPRSTLRSYIEETLATLADPKVHDAGGAYYPGDHCDAHPTGEQHRLIARDLEPVLRRALGW